jgi:hypothetical protein
MERPKDSVGLSKDEKLINQIKEILKSWLHQKNLEKY